MALRIIDLLPPSIADDGFMGRFVEIFDRLEATVAQRIDNADCYFDFTVAPIELVRSMASWVNLSVPPSWTEAEQRSFVIGVAGMLRWRGTARWLGHLLYVATGCDVAIDDPAAVTTLCGAATESAVVTIRLRGRCESLTVEEIHQMIREEMPAGVAYRLVFDDPVRGDD